MSRIIILMLMHAVGDFFLQGNRTSKLKALKIPYLIRHVGIYTITFIILSPLILGLTFIQGLYFSVLNGILHLGVDYFSSKVKLKYTDSSESKYIIVINVDHILHFLILISTYMFLFPKAINTFEPYFKYLN